MIFDSEGLSLQGITGGDGGDRRVEFILPPTGRSSTYRFWIEVSCNGMFGNGLGETNNPPDDHRKFFLAQADLVVPRMEAHRLLWDFTTLKHLAQQMPENSPLSNKCMEVANAIMNVFDKDDLESITAGRKLAEKVLGEGWEKEDVYKGVTGDVTVATVGNCHSEYSRWLPELSLLVD